tara:strand:+ start:2556 stop:3503 length:948 start_codon:yes stop_codon:yes gene_type:complete
MKNFGLIGSAGYIAPRHLNAIKETNNNLLASYDVSDSVGILDSYFPNSKFFTDFERFDRYVDSLRYKNKSKKIDFMTICSPNHLHDSHIRFSLKSGIDVICEKPVTLNTWNLKKIIDLEMETNRKVKTILQLRYHKAINDLKRKIEENDKKTHEVELTYITSRGEWYFNSWKGNTSKSGGISTNIGIHFFDILYYLFGNFVESEVYLREKDKESGFLRLENANVKWFLSIDQNDLKPLNFDKTMKTFRSIKVDGEEIEFSKNFNDLHTKCYEEILKGRGFGLNEALKSIEIVSSIRNSKISRQGKNTHSLINTTA